jgi:transcriptional regulator NrdR family protein
VEFFPFDKAKLKNAFDRALRKKKIVNSEINAILKKIENVRSYSDEPCKIIIASVQWRIFGLKDGNKIQKLIQFDNPQ